MQRGQASAPGSCGELVQGAIDGVDFLVTCPVDLFATATVSICQEAREHFNRQPIPGVPGGCNAGRQCRRRARAANQKALIAALRTLEILHGTGEMASYFRGDFPLGRQSGCQSRCWPDCRPDCRLDYWPKGWPGSRLAIHIASELPRAKGMASSTADIAATCVATARALGREGLSPDEIANIALDIEPTDGIMFPGIVLFDHVRGITRRSLGPPPPIDILIIDLGGDVDTIAFNSRDDLAALNCRKEPIVRDALALVEEGIRLGDAAMVGEGATLSALAHQSILPKPELPDLIRLAKKSGAVGVNIAHSGTVVGIIIDRKRGDSREVTERLRRGTPASRHILGEVQVIGGGVL